MSKRKTSVPRRPRQWVMREVHSRCPSAAAVWVALRDMVDALGTPHLTPTRKQLSNLSGVRDLDSISKALGVLAQAGWIRKETIPVTHGGKISAKVLSITLIRKSPRVSQIEAARDATPYARSNPASPMPGSSGHWAPAEPGIATPGSTGHESSYRRPATAANPKAAGGGRVPPGPDKDTFHSKPTDPPVPSAPGLGKMVMERFAPWSPPDHLALWNRLQEHGRNRQAAEYAVVFKQVLAVLDLDPADTLAHRALITMISGVDWPAHEQMMASTALIASTPSINPPGTDVDVGRERDQDLNDKIPDYGVSAYVGADA